MYERLTYWNEEYECWSYKCASGDAAKRLADYEGTGLTPEQIKDLTTDKEIAHQELEKVYEKMLESQQIIHDIKNKIDLMAALIKHLTADKDEQAGRIMRMEGGLRRLKSSFQWLSEDMRGRGYKDWAEDKMNDIDDLLGGAKDGK